MDSSKLMKTFARMGVFAIALLLLHPAAFAEKEYVARTAKNVDISIDDLNAMLLPLTQAQLEVEATAWRKVLTRKVAQISKLEIMKRNSPQTVGLIDQVGEQLKDSVGAVVPATGSDAGADAAGSQADAAAAKASAELDTQIAVMRVEQGGINKRFGIVLDALESKGGSVEEQRLYLSAVSGIKLNVDDTAAGLLAVKEWLVARMKSWTARAPSPVPQA